MRLNPKPIFDISIFKFKSQAEFDEANWLYTSLINGQIPDRAPFPYEKLQLIAHCFKMWTFIYTDFVIALARAIQSEFGQELFILEIMAGMGWLAKGLKDAGLPGVYIATDSNPSTDSVYPIAKAEAVEAVITHYHHANLYIVTWPPPNDISLDLALNYIPVGSILLYIGEPFPGCCATQNFFEKTEMIEPLQALSAWKKAQELYFKWPSNHDRIFLLRKVK